MSFCRSGKNNVGEEKKILKLRRRICRAESIHAAGKMVYPGVKMRQVADGRRSSKEKRTERRGGGKAEKAQGIAGFAASASFLTYLQKDPKRNSPKSFVLEFGRQRAPQG